MFGSITGAYSVNGLPPASVAHPDGFYGIIVVVTDGEYVCAVE